LRRRFGRKEEKKQFFFGKKNQKTFFCLGCRSGAYSPCDPGAILRSLAWGNSFVIMRNSALVGDLRPRHFSKRRLAMKVVDQRGDWLAVGSLVIESNLVAVVNSPNS